MMHVNMARLMLLKGYKSISGCSNASKVDAVTLMNEDQ